MCECLIMLAIALVTLSMIEVATSGHHKKRNPADLAKSCTLGEFTTSGNCHLEYHTLTCEEGIASNWIKGIHSEVRSLMIVRWPGECFNVARLEQHYPTLEDFQIHNCTHLNYIKGHFTSTCKIERLIFRGVTSLWEIPPELIALMQHLQVLDLRHNHLRHIKPRLLRNPPNLKYVYLSENKWDCSDGGLDWLAMERDNGTVRSRIVDYRQLMCHQQLYRGKPLHRVMEIIKMVKVKCPQPCCCAMTHVVSNRAGDIIPLITVDCSNLNLTFPPASLPPSTTTLKLEGNQINTMRTILHNPQYRKIADIYLDNNSIPSVKELEASEWFSTFRVLSLRGNMLRQIPVYAFDKAFQSNNNIMHVFLGNNPWRCDCHYTPRFQALLLKYKRVIRDLDDIRCTKTDDAVTSLAQISTISLGTVCHSSENKMPVSTVNIVNIVLSLLILIVVGKFVYDWHSFRTTGKLPWLSSVLP